MNTIYLLLIILTMSPSHPQYEDIIKNGDVPFQVLRPMLVESQAKCAEVEAEIRAQVQEHVKMYTECRGLSYPTRHEVKI